MNAVIQAGHIPLLEKVAIIHLVLKTKEDPKLAASYRPLSLINNLTKLIASLILVNRVQTALEEENLIAHEQAGCREGHEYLQNLAALSEAVEQRRHLELHTYIAFIDIAKAFDSVPFCAFLFKLYAQGCRDQAFWLIRELYRDAGSKIRKGGATSDFIHLQKSVRQGCPGSTPIFILFMNDVKELLEQLDTQEIAGIKVKGLGNLLRALLFADDVVLIAATVRDLEKSLHPQFWQMVHNQ
jgi:hypothetical protein